MFVWASECGYCLEIEEQIQILTTQFPTHRNREFILAECGYCSSLETAGQRRIDLVLLDVMMPEMNGYEVCKRLKAEQSDYLPVLLITALGEQEDRNRGLEAGALTFALSNT